MTTRYYLYGSVLSLSAAREEAEVALGITFDLHESFYRGGNYYRYSDNFILQHNLELDNEVAEPDFSDMVTLLYVSQVADPEGVRNALLNTGNFQLLRHEC